MKVDHKPAGSTDWKPIEVRDASLVALHVARRGFYVDDFGGQYRRQVPA